MKSHLFAVAFCAVVAAGPVAAQTVVITPPGMATTKAEAYANPVKWFFYNDETDLVDNSLGSFVVGPALPPQGTESVEISVSGTQRRNLATYRFSGLPLANVTALGYSTYTPAGNPTPANRAGYLQFNVDFNGTDTWQRRLLFLPKDNGTVLQDVWQSWDAFAGGTAKWRYSGPTWPGTTIPGATPRTFNNIVASYPGVRVRVTDAFFGIRVGEPYTNGFTTHLDAITVGTAVGTTVFDFDFNHLPTTREQCMQGGWQTRTYPDGSPFLNQGQCVQFVNTGK